ncbi:MAG: hypothetical protein J5X22_11250 [Candidatus Accumulibacter sp.]|uniref:hypothetical protein n=1 Tax=Accumulibacter sp. TaxID=2053492 RepID=UPI001AC214C7|nr:hypothetical protein [Accumulibacter sp.]MBN8517759.1 hypothetical protein [Accumulibacter sp.]MBO3711065.1 hypothetical protein [Accumulibacter sp.]
MDINNLNIKDTAKVLLAILLIGSIGAGIAIFRSPTEVGATRNPSAKQNNPTINLAAEKKDSQLPKCVSAARQAGYGSGNCAHDFIEACLTGSRDKMQSVYSYDKSIGTIKDNYAMKSCGYPDTYAAAFDKF